MGVVQKIQKLPYRIRLQLLGAILLGILLALVVFWIVLAIFVPNPKSGSLFDSAAKRMRDSQNYWKKSLPPAPAPVPPTQ